MKRIVIIVTIAGIIAIGGLHFFFLGLQGSITILSPRTDEVYQPGDTFAITWESEEVQKVVLQFFKDNKCISCEARPVIVEVIQNPQTYTLELGDFPGESTNYQIRVSDTENPKVFAISQSFTYFIPDEVTPFIAKLVPTSGEPGSEVEVVGSGFAGFERSGERKQNTVHLGDRIITDLRRYDGSTFVFQVPESISPRDYDVSITNVDGISNKAVFTVIAPSN